MQALRDEIEQKGEELRREWGPAAAQASSRAVNLSHYIALRSHDLTDLQLRLAAAASPRSAAAKRKSRRRSMR